MFNIKENEKMISVQADSMLDVIEMDCPSKSLSNVRKFKGYIGKSGAYQIGKSSLSRTLGGFRSQAEVLDAALIGSKRIYEDHFLPKYNQVMIPGSHVNDYEENISVVKRKRIQGYQGDELDIHKVYQGQLDKAWTKMQRVEVAQKFHMVTILINIGGTYAEDTYDSLWRSAIAVRLMEELERAGKSVKIVAGTTSMGSIAGSKLVSATVNIKNFNEQLSPMRLAAMTHLGFYRTVGFALKCCIDNRLFDNMGVTIDTSENSMPIQLREEVEAGHTKFVHIGRVNSYQEAISELKNCYNQMEEFSA